MMKVYFAGYFNEQGGLNMLSHFDGDDKLSEAARLFSHKAGAFELLKSIAAECDGKKLDVIEFDLNFFNPRVV